MNRNLKKILLPVMAMAVVMAVSSCGDSGSSTNSGKTNTATTPTTVIVNDNTPTQTATTPAKTGTSGVSGTWNGQWANEAPDKATGTFNVQLVEQASTLTGMISISGTPCLSGGSVTGTINGSQINFGVVEGEVTVNYAGTISGNSMSGTYATNCGNAYGNWQAAIQ